MKKNNKNVLAEIFEGYKGGDEMPLAGYAALLGVYNAFDSFDFRHIRRRCTVRFFQHAYGILKDTKK